MLSPINCFGYSSAVYKNKGKGKNKNKINTNTLTCKADLKKAKIGEKSALTASIYNNNINFCAYIDLRKKNDFEKTIDKNFFKLPQITLDDGTIYRFQPDEAQIRAAKKIYEGDSVIFSAPTGTGKTALAHYAINKNLENNKKTIYTSPQIALANDKYNEFCKIYGNENIGLLTGDIKHNPNAPIVIMTTEIYDNMAACGLQNAAKIGSVIFDEAHYINDEQRGVVWENSIINTPQDKIQLLFLSATIGNSSDFASWIQSLSPKRAVSNIEVEAKDRFVPLVYSIYKWNKEGAKDGEFIPIINQNVNLSKIPSDVEKLNPSQRRAFEYLFRETNNKNEYYKPDLDELQKTMNLFLANFEREESLDLKDFQKILEKIYPNIDKITLKEISCLLADDKEKSIDKIHLENFDPRRIKKFNNQLINSLKDNDMLPAIFFKLSQGECEFSVNSFAESSIDLTTDEEKEEIKKIFEKYKKDKIYLGSDFDEQTILKGFSYHHAGTLPQYRKLIEELFQKKLLKVVVATSTLSLGINMPARTVVMSDMAYRKYNPELNSIEQKPLNASEFHQMAGRAGRRGIDKIGNVVLYNLKTPKDGFRDELSPSSFRKPIAANDDEIKIDELALAYELLESPSNPLRSHYKPDWCMLSDYYTNNSDFEALKTHIDNSFKVFLTKNKEKEAQRLLNKFENYKNTLKKLGFVEINHNKKVNLTPKGELLRLARGVNPLLLSDLIYNEKFKDLDVFSLIQIAGYIAGSNEQKESEFIGEILNPQMEKVLNCSSDDEKIVNFNKIIQNISKKEMRIIKATKESKAQKEDIMYGNAFSSYISYAWAILNDNNQNSVDNFIRLTKEPMTDEDTDDYLIEARSEYLRKIKQGSVYKIISQSVSTLKTIARICDFALMNPEKFPNTSYYENLKENSELALLLLVQKPVNDLVEV